MNKEASDRKYLLQAIKLSKKCPPSETAYSVGCVIVKDGKVISTGYSREADPVFHAEETALSKLGYVAEGATVYTTMEPCNFRKSRPHPCAQLIYRAKAARVVYGCNEPSNFVAKCDGVDFLRSKGIEVIQIPELAEACLEANSHLLKN